MLDSAQFNAAATPLLPYGRGFLPHFRIGRRIVRDLAGLPASLGRIGSLEVRLAVTKKEIRRAQKLRWRVFFEEGGAIPDARSLLRRRDICPFDRACDHLFVLDHEAAGKSGRKKPRVVGAYRLLRQDVAERHNGFYSATEFDIDPLLRRHADKRFLELGRSCVLPEYRSRKTLELLWRGIWTYVRHHRVDVLMGCASFDGANIIEHAGRLAFLQRHARAEETWRVRPLPGRSAEIGMVQIENIDARRALAGLPPLIKGYLRLGATIGDGAVVDHRFGTTDVFVVMPVAQIDARYVDYFTMPVELPKAAA